MMHRLLWHTSCARCLTRDTIWQSVGRQTETSPLLYMYILLNFVYQKTFKEGKLAFFWRGVWSKEKDSVMFPTTSSAASARSRQNSMALAISSLLGVSSVRIVSSLCLCLIYRWITECCVQFNLAYIHFIMSSVLTQIWAALSSPPPQGGRPPPPQPYLHLCESSCLGWGVSIRSLPGTYGNLLSSTLSGTLPVEKETRYITHVRLLGPKGCIYGSNIL